ncbi:hypothetical protein [uncultured Clostridium sp.]|uniref:hypothetical protein n=1 Tax=uncultured Clostridium sp. TaxID=59620 RepID=UPI0025E887E1|nr:hypothetical protein [uncultured Clostridium sp.]MDU4883441.1 hypothetical protein [Clostridium celatum]MDU7076504.1 hypothetical protein [Clostridium celatum]
MKIKIICLEDEKNVKFDNILSKFEIVGNNGFKKRAKYYNIEKSKVEVYYLMEKEDLNKYNLNNNSDMILVLAKSLNEKNIERVKKIRNDYNIIVITGEVNILNKNVKAEFNKLNNVVIINKLKKENTIDINLLVAMLKHKEIFLNLNKQKNTILIDSNESIGKIALSILEQFNYIENSKEYNLYLYSKEEVGIQELAYLEDPIKEYIYNDAIFRINTVINKNINNKSYFLVATAK